MGKITRRYDIIVIIGLFQAMKSTRKGAQLLNLSPARWDYSVQGRSLRAFCDHGQTRGKMKNK